MERQHPDIRFTSAEDGAAIAFWEIGKGRPVVMIQNFSLTHAEWEWEVPSIASFYTDLARRYRVVRFDWRGIGLSGDRPGGWERPLSIGELCLDIEAVANAIGLDSFVLLATSIACPVGIEFAAKHPDLVSELILCQGFATVASSHVAVAMRTEQEIAKYESETGQAFHSIWERVFPEDGLEPIRRMNRLAWARTGGGPTGRQEWDSEPMLGQIEVPTLVISSPTPDEAVRDARNLAAEIPGSQLRIVAGASSPILTDRRSTLDVITDFLESDSPVASTIPAGFRTVVFTDMVDSTKFMSEVGDEEGREVMRAVEERVSVLADQHGGRVIKNLGDGSLISFGSNTAALRFALELQTQTDHDSLQLRIGMAAGEPIEEGGDIHGAVVAYASRVADLGGAGEIIASDSVRQLAMGKGFSFTSMGQHELKGFEEPATVWKVTATDNR